jgi:hypothetical protein
MKTFHLVDPSRLDAERGYAPFLLARLVLTDDGLVRLTEASTDRAADDIRLAFRGGIRHEAVCLHPEDGIAFVRALREAYGNPCGLILQDVDACAAFDAQLERSPAPPSVYAAVAS